MNFVDKIVSYPWANQPVLILSKSDSTVPILILTKILPYLLQLEHPLEEVLSNMWGFILSISFKHLNRHLNLYLPTTSVKISYPKNVWLP